MRKTRHTNNTYNNGPMFEELSDGEDDSYSHSNNSHHHHSNNSSVRYEDPDDHYNTHSRHSHNTSNRRTSQSHNYTSNRRREDNPFDLMSNSLFQNDPFFSNSFDMMSSMMKTSEQMFKRMNQDFESHFNNSLLHDNNTNNNGYTSYSSITTTSSSRRNDGNNQCITKTKQTIKDSKTGKEKISIIKQVNDKKSITEKTRDGKEQVFKKLENVSTDQDFDKEWKQYSKQLPKFKSSSVNSLSHNTHHNNNQSLLNENRRALNYEKKK